ncbi:DUF581 domain-containing protein [Cephalotus follicularis]|uniref:DUF581 domain-containing protein n=1 Tax=Cephalotus follicularis TaxID=3775 RepID=A0A1Q3C7K1_CEPFO|nr:DUF581 domain-containing protein [Cephalotus follicularis]
MLGKGPRPMIGKLSELFVSGYRAGILDVATSPRSPLDYKIQSPRGLKSYDVGGVGLGIVAALEKSSNGGHEILAKYAICTSNLNRSNPIPVNSGKNCDGARGAVEELGMDSLEDYTYVTCHGHNKSITKVYYDGGDRKGSEHVRSKFDIGVVEESPARFMEDFLAYPTSDFLNSCHLCMRKLHGKDIYMYRGEKAFCSTECRSSQIMMDECKERCRSETSRSADFSSSPYSRDQIFSTGILAV